MNVLDSISATVMSIVNGPLHGRLVTYTYVPPQALPTFSGTISASALQATYTGEYDFINPFLITVGTEVILVTGRSGTGGSTVIIERAMLGTTAAIHNFSSQTPVIKNALSFYVIIEPSLWDSVFDTGTDEIDFNGTTIRISKKDLPFKPQETGRGGAGDNMVFEDVNRESGRTWHVRNLENVADYSGAFYQVLITDYSGPINGV